MEKANRYGLSRCKMCGIPQAQKLAQGGDDVTRTLGDREPGKFGGTVAQWF